MDVRIVAVYPDGEIAPLSPVMSSAVGWDIYSRVDAAGPWASAEAGATVTVIPDPTPRWGEPE